MTINIQYNKKQKNKKENLKRVKLFGIMSWEKCGWIHVVLRKNI